MNTSTMVVYTTEVGGVMSVGWGGEAQSCSASDNTQEVCVRVCSICGDPFCFDRECAVVNREALHQRTYTPCKNCGDLVYYSPDDVVMLHRDGSYFCEGHVVVDVDGKARQLTAS